MWIVVAQVGLISESSVLGNKSDNVTEAAPDGNEKHDDQTQ